MTCPSSDDFKAAEPSLIRAGQVRRYEDRGQFIKYVIMSYSELAGSFAPCALCIVLDTNMSGKIHPGCQMEVNWNASLFTNSVEVEL